MDADTAAPPSMARHLQLDSPMVRDVTCVREDHHHLDFSAGYFRCFAFLFIRGDLLNRSTFSSVDVAVDRMGSFMLLVPC
jgi:hypothetical protein